MKRAIIPISIVFLLFAALAEASALTSNPAKSQKIERFTGRVGSINIEDSEIVVQSMKSGMTFDIKGIKLKGYKSAANIKEGDRVTVQYVIQNGKATARSLTKNKSYH